MNLDIDGSIGIALYPQEGDDVDVLVQRADVAMYRAKEHHKGWESYAAEHDQYTVNRLVLVSDLRRAVENNDFLVALPSQGRPSSGEATGVEALIRWDHAAHGMVLPDEFIPVAERTGLMRPLTLQVLEKALRNAGNGRKRIPSQRGGQHLSEEPARSGPSRRYRPAAGQLRRTCSRLELEITESTIMADPARAHGHSPRPSQHGDPGRSTTSAPAIPPSPTSNAFPVDEIKIDKSFVTHLTPSSDDAIIVRSTVDMAASLGLAVMAEGVETAANPPIPPEHRLPRGPGILHKPAPTPDDVAGWVTDWRTKARTLLPPTTPAHNTPPLQKPSSFGQDHQTSVPAPV